MTWEKIKQGLRAVTAPAIYLMSGFDGDVAANYIRSSDDPLITNGSSKSWNAFGKVLSNEQYDKIIKALEKSGDSDGIEKIVDLKKNKEENIKDWIARIKGASLEERRQIMDEITSQTKSEQAAVNQILQANNRKLEKQSLKTLEQAQEAKQDGDNKEYLKLLAISQEQEKELHQGRLLLEHGKKKIEKINQTAKEQQQLAKANQTWYSDISWSSWQVWLVLISFLAFGYLIYRTIMWAYENYLAKWIRN